MWGECGYGEVYFGGTTGQFALGFLTASINIYPALCGTIAIAAALEGQIELSAAFEMDSINVTSALDADINLSPALEGIGEVEPQ